MISAAMNTTTIYFHKLGLCLPGTVQNTAQSVAENSNPTCELHVTSKTR